MSISVELPFIADDIVAKCDEAERDISAGRVSDGFEMLDRVGTSVGV